MPTGGTIEDGIYVATELTIYDDSAAEGTTPPGLPPITLEVFGSEFHSVSLGGPDFTTVVRGTSRVTTNGVELKFRRTCSHPEQPPDAYGLPVRYTYDDGTLRQYVTSADVTSELTLKKVE